MLARAFLRRLVIWALPVRIWIPRWSLRLFPTGGAGGIKPGRGGRTPPPGGPPAGGPPAGAGPPAGGPPAGGAPGGGGAGGPAGGGGPPGGPGGGTPPTGAAGPKGVEVTLGESERVRVKVGEPPKDTLARVLALRRGVIRVGTGFGLPGVPVGVLGRAPGLGIVRSKVTRRLDVDRKVSDKWAGQMYTRKLSAG